MSNPLTSTKQNQEMLAVNSTTNTQAVDIGSTEGPIAIQISWTGASSADMVLTLEFSNDKQVWIPLTDKQRIIDSDVNGGHLWDLSTGVEFVRVNILVNGGSANFVLKFNGKSR